MKAKISSVASFLSGKTGLGIILTAIGLVCKAKNVEQADLITIIGGIEAAIGLLHKYFKKK